MTDLDQIQLRLNGFFYLASAEVEAFAKCQPGDWLVHTNDVQAVLNTLRDRIDAELGMGA